MELIIVPPEQFGAAGVTALERSLGGIEQPCLGLPTGGTPVPVFRHLFASGFTFPAGTSAFAVDEYRWGDPGHPGTNASFFRDHWRSGAGVPEVAVPRADAPDPDAEVQEYCRRIASRGGFDVVLLGIGLNGHIAFNEPGSARDSTCRVVRLAEQTRRSAGAWTEPPEEGLTVGVRELIAARRVILLANGAAKREILRDALTGPVTPDVPASYLQEHPALTVVCDEAAGALLDGKSKQRRPTPHPLPSRERGAYRRLG